MTNRTLGWATKDGDLIQVCDMEDAHLLNAINLLRRRIVGGKLATGVTSCSLFTLDYLIDEARERNILPSIDADSSDP